MKKTLISQTLVDLLNQIKKHRNFADKLESVTIEALKRLVDDHIENKEFDKALKYLKRYELNDHIKNSVTNWIEEQRGKM